MKYVTDPGRVSDTELRQLRRQAFREREGCHDAQLREKMRRFSTIQLRTLGRVKITEVWRKEAEH